MDERRDGELGSEERWIEGKNKRKKRRGPKEEISPKLVKRRRK